jgi:hypothetical protein
MRHGRRLAVLWAAALALFSLAVSTGAASAATGTGTAKPAVSAHHASSAAADLALPKPGRSLVHPMTGTGCHTYNYWSGAHVCITVNGAGLNVQSVDGYTDGPDSDWGKLYDTAGVITIWGHPTNHNLFISWASGGGVWLANGDNFCFSDTTLGQTACLTIHT